MSIFNKPKKGGIADIIRCDEENYLVWKWHPNGVNQGDVKRENAIRTNSILRVKSGEVAVFVYNQKNGNNMDFIYGPYDEKLKTKNFPILSSIIGLWYEGDTPFQAEIYFINVSYAQQIKFGVPYFNVIDPRFSDFEVPIAVRGSLTFGISDCKKFISCHQLVTFTPDDLKNKILDSVTKCVKDVVTNAPSEYEIPVIIIESKISLINETIQSKVKERIFDLFGVTLNGLDISDIELDKESDSYNELKTITKNVTMRQTEANILNYEEQLKIQREEGKYAQRMATRTSNLGAYETEVKKDIGVAGAEALGKMGEKGAGNINMGGNTGFNPMAMMAGMAVGSTVGQNIANTIGTATNQKTVPPSIPVTKFFVAKDNNPTGPFDIDSLRIMISSGSFKSDDLVWKEGMAQWEPACAIPELNALFPPRLGGE